MHVENLRVKVASVFMLSRACGVPTMRGKNIQFDIEHASLMDFNGFTSRVRVSLAALRYIWWQ